MPHFLEPTTFLVDHLGPFKGLRHEQEEPMRPLFLFHVSFEIALSYTHLMPEEPDREYRARYDAENDAFCFFDPAEKRWISWHGEQHGNIRLYPIGYGEWTWSPMK
jgi:hypothetical protein